MVRAEERSLGWDFREIYETPHPDLLEDEAFFHSFAKRHDINGHNVICIFTRAKEQRVVISGVDQSENVSSLTSVLLVQEEEMHGMRLSESVRVDGKYYQILNISQPLQGMFRIELAGHG